MRTEPAPACAAYACRNNDESTRSASSSGGVFSLLTESVLEAGGTVFGATFDANLDVVHRSAHEPSQVAGFRGSKYVMSRMGHVLSEVRDELQAGRPVLFSGTPCQVAGLRSFLKSDPSNLLCVDVFCFGVPSPAVWSAYRKDVAKQSGCALTGFSFRDKSRGWNAYSVRMDFEDGSSRLVPHGEDAYMRAFLAGLSLRSSCFACPYRTLHRVGDLTLADFWGVERLLPGMDDDRGTSLVLASTEKGKEAFLRIVDRCRAVEVDAATAAAGNGGAGGSPVPHPNRRWFFDHLESIPFRRLVRRSLSPWTPITVLRRIGARLRKARES